MTSRAYGLYLARRIAEAVLIAASAVALTLSLEACGILREPTLPDCAAALRRWVWPAGIAFLAHLILGPKQTFPIFRKVPGAAFVYAGVPVTPAAACRGGLTLGATGSGKTLCCIYPRLHSLCVNEPGIPHPNGRRPPGDGEARLRLIEHEARAAALEAALARRRTAVQTDLFQDSGPALGSADTDHLRHSLAQVRQSIRRLGRELRSQGFQKPPWGGIVFGEKGSEARAVASLLAAHGRSEDLRILEVGGSGSRQPAIRLNLLGMSSVPADTYAKLIVEAALAAEDAEKPDEFFVPQARDKIAWGIRLLRALEALSPDRDEPRVTLPAVLGLLSSPEGYREAMAEADADPNLHTSLPAAVDVRRARAHLERHYWSQPPEQLGGVQSTLYNFLAPFCEPAIAEVFCGESTFDLEEIELGIVVALSLPQERAVQRRYVANILKALCYHIVVKRLDRPPPGRPWCGWNLIVIEQDEWQRYAVEADADVDIIREAGGAAYMAAQTQDAVWAKFRGKEKASPLIANLRTRWLCQAASEACARESAASLGDVRIEAISTTRARTGNTTTHSSNERPVLPAPFLRSLAPFEVVFAPAEGPWVYRHGIAMPVTPEGTIPRWWFGTWNPWHWLAVGLGLPEKRGVPKTLSHDDLIAPWRARAPLKAQVRWLLGLDGTWITLTELSRKRARRDGHPQA